MSLSDLATIQQTQGGFLNTTVHNDIDNLVISVRDLTKQTKRLADLIEKPFIFLKSTNNIMSSNVADAVVILRSIRVPPGHKATVKDFNINFTTVAGTVRLAILDSAGSLVIDVLRDINSVTNGTGATVIEENHFLAVLGQTAGAGLFSVYCSGTIQKIEGEST